MPQHFAVDRQSNHVFRAGVGFDYDDLINSLPNDATVAVLPMRLAPTYDASIPRYFCCLETPSLWCGEANIPTRAATTSADLDFIMHALSCDQAKI